MAEGKNIEIKIAATGGDQAAAEVRKVDTAVDSLSGGGGAASGKGLKALAEETTKVSAANVKMGTGFQNVGYQVQDLAVQIGSGTSAMRAMGQQLPQLLSGFGPMGAAVGTLAAVGVPLVGVLLDQAKAAEDFSEASSEATQETIKMAQEQAQATRMDAEALARKKDLTETLRVITKEQYSYNNSLQEQLDILKETQAAENEVAAARGQLEIDKAEGDPVKQEQVRNQVRKEAQERELAQIEARRRAASELIDRKGAQEVGVGEAGEAKAAELRGQAASAAEEALRQEQLAELKRASAADKDEAGKANKAKKPALEREARKLREEARKAEEAAESLRGQEKDFKGQADTVDSTTKAEVEKLQAEANKLFDEVQKLAREEETKKKLFGIRDEQGDVREGRVRKQEAGREARENYKDYQDFRREQGRDQAEQRKDANAGRDLETEITDIGKDAAKATRGIGAKGINPEGFNTLAAKIAKKGNPEQDKIDLSSFLSKIGQLVDNIPDSKSDSVDAQALREVERKLEKKIETLTQRIRNK